MSSPHRPGMATIFPLLYAPTQEDVQFACPWCSTKLSLPQKDFMAERAVLCPRCNNPIDMEIQRRLYKSSPQGSRAPPPTRTPPPSSQRRDVSVPKRREPPREKPVPPPTPSPSQVTDSGHADWTKPLDVDSYFGADQVRRKEMDHLMGGSEPGRQPGSQRVDAPRDIGEAPPAPNSGKVKCPSCDFENSTGYDPFRTGPPKCAWCGKPLPQ